MILVKFSVFKVFLFVSKYFRSLGGPFASVVVFCLLNMFNIFLETTRLIGIKYLLNKRDLNCKLWNLLLYTTGASWTRQFMKNAKCWQLDKQLIDQQDAHRHTDLAGQYHKVACQKKLHVSYTREMMLMKAFTKIVKFIPLGSGVQTLGRAIIVRY